MQEKIFDISEKLGEALIASSLTIATAESCTGGLLGHLLTSVSGSSAYYLGGVIAYSNAVKEAFLGVRHETLVKYGAVSEQTAKEMAAGTRERIGSDIGISTTGIAGPTGGTLEKPVGLVYIGISTAEKTFAIKCNFKGSRENVKEETARTLLKKTLEMVQEKAEEERKKKILILMSDAGMGHRSASNALRDTFQLMFGEDCEVVINNPLDHPKTPKALHRSQTDYDSIIKHLPDLYKVGYQISDSSLPVTFIEGGLIAALYLPLRDILLKNQPDLVISTFPLYQAPLEAVLAMNNQPRSPLFTTITDLVSVHQLWFDRNITRLAVPTEEVKQLALKAGLKESQIIMTGIPVNPRISQLQQADPNELRRELGWDENLTPILVVGSPRMYNLGDLLPALDQCEAPFQLVLVAGGNEDFHNQLLETEWKHPTHIYNFVDDLPKMMRASGMNVCKAGGLIVTESLASGLPLLLVDALPGQEIGNMEFVVAHGAGEYHTTPEDVQDCITRWFANHEEVLKQIAENAKKIGKPEAAFRIVDEAWKIIQEGPIDTTIKPLQVYRRNLQELLDRFNINLSD
ncbi:nicotinamide-nucleotide amidohydrolase family protein [Chloroflexota bacterium]|nr:nicotinamide-nucleotide amidohydrolase family protein [Chloroflexota bacterium]